jgi:GntR family transcriptional regulator
MNQNKVCAPTGRILAVAPSRAGGPALYRRIADTLRGRLDDGTYQPDSRLPSEPILAAELKVHRLTVRRALDELAREGLIQPRQGAGTFVTRRPAPLAVTVPLTREEFTSSLRAQLETRGQRYTDRLISTELGDDTQARRQLRAPRSRLRRVDSNLEVDAEVWVCSTAWGPDRLLHNVASTWRQTDGIYGVLLDGPAAPLRYLWRSFAAETASVEDAQRLGVKPGSPVLVREGLTGDSLGKPVLWVRRRARFDRVRYVLHYA